MYTIVKYHRFPFPESDKVADGKPFQLWRQLSTTTFPDSVITVSNWGKEFEGEEYHTIAVGILFNEVQMDKGCLSYMHESFYLLPHMTFDHKANYSNQQIW